MVDSKNNRLLKKRKMVTLETLTTVSFNLNVRISAPFYTLKRNFGSMQKVLRCHSVCQNQVTPELFKVGGVWKFLLSDWLILTGKIGFSHWSVQLVFAAFHIADFLVSPLWQQFINILVFIEIKMGSWILSGSTFWPLFFRETSTL